MDDAVLYELFVANKPEEKAAIIAESIFSMLSEEASLIARRCSIIHWFNEVIVAALSKDIPSAESQLRSIYEQIRALPFVESLPWGLTFNSLTREGLLSQYTATQPELLRAAARLAAPAFKALEGDGKIIAEAFFCYTISGETALALELLDALVQQAALYGDREYISGLLALAHEAQQFPFVPHLPISKLLEVYRFELETGEKESAPHLQPVTQILLDTSALIDGRIADISQTGFITGTLVVPRFVLNELQHIADSADAMRRNQGRRGLEMLNRLQKDATIPIEITDADVEGVIEVDSKLVKMAQTLHCPIITNEFNLNRVAELQGVKVLNINELANAVKPILLPGEDTFIKIMQDGKELGQGVGYLDDGTMFIVEGGRQYIGMSIEVTVTRVLQTVAGRMIFAHPKQQRRTSSSPSIQPPQSSREEKEAAQKNRDATAQTRYLRTTMAANQSITPKGFATHSQAVIFANVPLEATFVQLQTVSDRPVFDAPYEQLRQLELVRRRTDLSDEMRDTYMQRLRIAWHSQLGPKRNVTPQSVPVNEVLLRLTPAHPVAVILGTPGSGKSTLLRWLALHMARASFSQNYALPAGFAPAQVPLLVHLRDYAESLGKESFSMKQFIAAQASKIDPNAPTKLLDELAHGHCLVLFDGLDELTAAHARGYVTDALYEFIADYTGEESGTHRYNRFLVTSRIAGYEPRALAKYAHYTLLDFDKQQIEQFLTNWCTATECYLTMAARGMQDLTQVEKETANRAGIEQRDRLLQILNNNLDLRQLAVNPLTLTMMAILHASGRIFPYQRMELYHMVVHTLLTTWNQESGRAMFADEEIPLAELLLGNIAYRLQNGPPALSAHDLHLLARETMVAFDQRQANEIKEGDIRLFIETLRTSSGLLVEIGENLFCLARLAFQDYFVAQYLLRKPQEELKQFVLDHCHQATWREPLLLVIAHKSTDGSLAGQQEVNELLQAIMDAGSSNQLTLQANLVFVINCLTESVPWWIDSKLHQHVANHLFTFCGDALASGRFKHIPQELKASTTAWLRSQAQGQDEQGNVLPLLLTWRMALCDDTHSACQEGAACLLAELASDLPPIHAPILDGLCAPLLQLAGASGFQYPVARQADLPSPPARAASPEIKGYAHTALLKLGKRSLPGQAYESWLLSKKQEAMPSQQSSVAPPPQQS